RSKRYWSSDVCSSDLTNQPFNVYVFCHHPPTLNRSHEQQWLNYLAPLFKQFSQPLPKQLNDRYRTFLDDKDLLQVLLLTRPRVVSFHFGLPKPEQLELLHAAGIFTLATATSTQEAQLIRSEEHTSELQSRFDLVCRLLLEK